jgi:hypothetical protein
MACFAYLSAPVIPLRSLQFPSTGKYLYADANNNTLDFSSGDVSDPNSGALSVTLQQAYGTQWRIISLVVLVECLILV